MQFEAVGEITDVEPIATGKGVRVRQLLVKRFGRGDWRKLKGIGRVRMEDGTVRVGRATLVRGSWLGRKKMRIKRFLD